MSYLSSLIERSSPGGQFNGEPPAHLPAENGLHVYRAAIVTPIITFFFVVMRFYTRAHVLKKKFTADDYVVALTMPILIAHAVLMALATRHGMGLHIWQFDKELNAEYYLWVGISSEFYCAGLLGYKVALVLLYLQLFGVNNTFRWICYATLFFCVAYLVCNMVTEFFGCWPIEKKWLPSTPGHCIDSKITNSFYGACSMASDLVIAILPLTMVWKLQFPSKRQKVGLSVVLSCGFIAWAVAVARWGIAVYNMFTYDRPWYAGLSFTLSILEVNTGLMCACVATLGPLYQRTYTQLKHWSERRGSSGAGGSSWPSHKRSHGSSRDEKSRRASEAAARRDLPLHNLTIGGTPFHAPDYDAPARRPHDDEYGLLDMSTLRAQSSLASHSQRSLEV
ncbi:hypothetical protein F4778DRAFT_604613 [Xylariomycetidae sp. FL2044]|nr:hypothetical protein F4778DRAFT_604613 [Xylariomycetidae sp. FL2044]